VEALLILAALAFVLAMVFVRGFADGLLRAVGVVVGLAIDMLAGLAMVAGWFI
jgi:hypothetical protein